LKEVLLPVLAHVEAYIDFPEEDISPDTGAALVVRMDEVMLRARRLIDTGEQGRILRQGARTVICGEPNVGKSSLLNVLLGFERAIVNPSAGTTRDTIEEVIQVHGIPLRLVDTAGLRAVENADGVERVGMERTRRELQRADLILEVVDGSLPAAKTERVELPPGVESRRLLLLNKADLGVSDDWPHEAVKISCQTGSGVEELRAAIRALVLRAGPLLGEHPVAINARHQVCFERVATHVIDAKSALQNTSRWICERRSRPWERWWGMWMWKRCWISSSPVSASASEASLEAVLWSGMQIVRQMGQAHTDGCYEDHPLLADHQQLAAGFFHTGC
jgi:tRNA modification GTPase